MAKMKCIGLFNVLVILFIVLNCVSTILSDDLEEDDITVMTDKELYERQKQKFGDALGYGYSEENRYRGNGVNKKHDKSNEGDEGAQADVTQSEKHAQKRSASGSDVFGLPARKSSGSVRAVAKNNISLAVDVITTYLLDKPVIVTRKRLQVDDVGQVPFFVDKSVNKLTLEIKTPCCKPEEIVVTDPTGNNMTLASPNVRVMLNTTKMTYVEISGTFVPGRWILTIYDSSNQDYDVTIHGNSDIYFNLKFCDKTGEAVSAQPILDSNSTYVKLTPFGNDLVSKWTFLQIKDVNGTVVQRIPLKTILDSSSTKAFFFQVVWPNMDMRVGVFGQDDDGNTFTRELGLLVQPLTFYLKLNNTGTEFIHSCFHPLTVPFTITNTGPNTTFVCQAESGNQDFVAVISEDDNFVSLDSHTTAQSRVFITLFKTPSSYQTTQILISCRDGYAAYHHLPAPKQYASKIIKANNIHCFDRVTASSVTPSPAKSSVSKSSVTPKNINGASALRKTQFNFVLPIVVMLLAFMRLDLNHITL